jgi:hypothetical protein
MGLCNWNGFPLLDMELDLSRYHHGGGSLALCQRGGGKSDAFPCRRCGACHHYVELVPFAWIRQLD